jgi:hypothetical protein
MERSLSGAMERGKQDRRASRSRSLMLRAIRLFFLLVVVLPVSAFAQMRTCPVGFKDMPAMSTHYDQSSILKLP